MVKLEKNKKFVTLEDLATAISNKMDIPYNSALRDANFVMDLFGYENRIIDNILEHEDRQLFYMLEEEKFVISKREEIILQDGREWRTHYWILNIERINYIKNKKIVRDNKEQKSEEVYKNLTPDMWIPPYLKEEEKVKSENNVLNHKISNFNNKEQNNELIKRIRRNPEEYMQRLIDGTNGLISIIELYK